MNGKRTVFLAGDSTVQSYTGEHAPQHGWGQLLYRYFQGRETVKSYPSPGSRFPQAVSYELGELCVDNRAMAGRSSRSFREEGRLEDIGGQLQAGDFLLVQFAHNDANREKSERYVAVEDFAGSLMPYVELCRQKGAVCVLVTAIAMRCFGEDGKSCPVSFPEYRERMLSLAAAEDIPLLDLGAATAAHCERLGPEKTKELFLWVEPGAFPDSVYATGTQDNAHLQRAGADAFAGLAAQEILNYHKDDRLDFLKKRLRHEKHLKA